MDFPKKKNTRPVDFHKIKLSPSIFLKDKTLVYRVDFPKLKHSPCGFGKDKTPTLWFFRR